MGEDGESAYQSTEKKLPVEPIGARVLGEIDPRTLSKEVFNASPDLLFHGTAKDFEFSQAFDYRSEDYLRENDGSTTLGFGLYTTDDKAEADNYALVRRGKAETQIVKPFLPYQAKVLDLRAKTDTSRNASVPRELAEKWRSKYMEHYHTKKPREGFIGSILDSSETEYAKYLERALQQPSVDLRVMLETAHARELGSRNLSSPTWTLLFSEFMLEQGFDGLVYNEGSEGKSSKGGASFVFYNLAKVGTYESWSNPPQKEKTASTQV